jgi:cytochrome b561
MNTARTSYTSTAKALHWLVVMLLIIQYVIAWNMPHIGRNTIPNTIINFHFSLGVVILLVMFLRLIWKWMVPDPLPLAGVPPWQITSARIVHYVLYSLLFIIPVLGWMNASFRGFDISVFGLFTLPQLLSTRAPGFAWTGDVHMLISYYVLLPLVALHIFAGLYHEFVRGDGVLRRMLPTGWARA